MRLALALVPKRTCPSPSVRTNGGESLKGYPLNSNMQAFIWLILWNVSLSTRPASVRIPFRILKNLLAFGLILLGAVMFVTPGPGMFPIVLGVLLGDFPGKLKLQRWILSKPHVMNSMNWLRRKFRRPPLQKPKAKPKAKLAA